MKTSPIKFLSVSFSIVALFTAFSYYKSSHNAGMHEDLPLQNTYISDFDFAGYEKIGENLIRKFTIHGKNMAIEPKRFGFFRVAAFKEGAIKDPKATFYKKDVPVSYIVADKAFLNIPFSKNFGTMNNLSGALIKNIKFQGKVALITEDRRTLTCSALEWDDSKDVLLAKGNCILRYEGKSVKADLIKTNTALTKFEGRKNEKNIL